MARRRSGRAPGSTVRWIVIAVGVVAVIAAAWLIGAWYEAREQTSHTAAPAPAPPRRVERPLGDALPEPTHDAAPTATAAPPDAADAPPTLVLVLDESDGPVRERALRASSHPAFQGWLAEAGLVRRAVAGIDNIADGLSPRRQAGFLAPTGRFLVLGDPDSTDELRTDPAGYHRYDLVADVAASIDPDVVARLYAELRPTLEKAYTELGRSDETLDQRVRAAIHELLAAPIPSTNSPVLIAKVERYEYADPDLELLSDAQKHLLRMGPSNARRVQDTLRRIAHAIGMSGDEIPPAPSEP